LQQRSVGKVEAKDAAKSEAILADLAKYSPLANEGQEQPTAKEMRL